MKLPDNRNERIKILAMILMGGLAVIYAIIQLVILPVRDSYRKNTANLDRKKGELADMKKELSRSAQAHKDFATVRDQVQTLSQYLAQPILGTYLIGIQSSLEQFAGEADLRINPASEIGFSEIPGKKKDGSKHLIKSYGVRLNGSGGYSQLQALVRQLEASNPLLCMTELSINAQPLSPENHQINLTIEWPVEAEIEKSPDESPSPVATDADLVKPDPIPAEDVP
jgi:hypothetical protein